MAEATITAEQLIDDIVTETENLINILKVLDTANSTKSESDSFKIQVFRLLDSHGYIVVVFAGKILDLHTSELYKKILNLENQNVVYARFFLK